MAESSRTEPRSLAVLAIATSIILVGALVGIQVVHFLRSAQMDFEIFYIAGESLRVSGDIFAPVEHQNSLTYIYPPFLAFLIIPFTFLPLEVAAAIFTVINGLLLAVCLVAAGREALARTGGRLDAATLPVMVLVSVVFLLPRIKAELDQGQTDLLVLLGITYGLIWLPRHPILAGLALGLVANIKYQTVIFVPYLLIRRWWTAGSGFVIGAVLALLSGALVVGWAKNLEYVEGAFGAMARMIGIEVDAARLPSIYPVEWIGSISLTSTAARWSAALDEGSGVFLFFAALLAGACLLVGLLFYRLNGQRLFRDRLSPLDSLVLLEWMGLLTAAVAFGPQTKLRHLILLLPLVVLATRYLVVKTEGVSRWPLLLAFLLAFFFQLWPFVDAGKGGRIEELWRFNGGPMWFFMVLYFSVLWTGLRVMRVKGEGSPACARRSHH
jgi:hypothetical protein